MLKEHNNRQSRLYLDWQLPGGRKQLAVAVAKPLTVETATCGPCRFHDTKSESLRLNSGRITAGDHSPDGAALLSVSLPTTLTAELTNGTSTRRPSSSPYKAPWPASSNPRRSS